jgi:hypothetical protein
MREDEVGRGEVEVEVGEKRAARAYMVRRRRAGTRCGRALKGDVEVLVLAVLGWVTSGDRGELTLGESEQVERGEE